VDRHHLSSPRIALIVNPASGVGRAARLARAVEHRLSLGAVVEVSSGASAAESAALLAAAVHRYDAVVVLGGDGIVHLALQALAETDTPLGIIPAGTGNDVADVLGYPSDPLAAADAMLAALSADSVRRMDLGQASSGRWWATVLCAGFDSAANERANRMHWPRGPRRYDLAIAVELLRLAPRRFRVVLDDLVLDQAATLVAIGNTPQYGGGKKITPAGRIDDGRFAVTVVGPVSRLTLARLAPTLPVAGHLGHPAVRTYTARQVRLEAAATLAYADGERIGPLPMATTCVPDALAVLVPPGIPGPGFSEEP
jgi:diacylglycerol kinase (ATP)